MQIMQRVRAGTRKMLNGRGHSQARRGGSGADAAGLLQTVRFKSRLRGRGIRK